MAREVDDRRDFRLSNRAFCIVSFLVLFVAWLPVFLASYPGFYCYDVGSGGINLWEQYSTGELNSHHPVAHTLLVGSIISVIAEAADFNTGVAVYTCLQALGIAVALTAVLYWMKRNGSSIKLCIVALLYCALNPVVSMFAMCATKDVCFPSLWCCCA